MSTGVPGPGAIQPWDDDHEYLQANRLQVIVNMRRQGETFTDIAQAVDLSITQVRRIFYEEIRKLPAAEIALLRQEMSNRFDAYRKIAFQVLRARHFIVAPNGKVVYSPDETGENIPLLDHKPVLDAVHLLLSVDKEEMKLWGLAQPQKVDIEGQIVQYEIIGVDPNVTLG